MGLDVRWRDCGGETGRQWSGNCSSVAPAPIPAAALAPALAPLEQRRRALQRPLLEDGGWGAWAPHNYMSLISLPDSARVSLMLCQLSTRSCLTTTRGQDAPKPIVLRAGLHAFDRSFAQYYLNAFGAPVGLNVSVRWSGGSGNGLRLEVGAVSCVTRTSKSNCSDFAVVLAADFAWFRSGATAAGCQSNSCHMRLDPRGNLAGHSLTASISGGGEHRTISDAELPLSALAGFATVDVHEPAGQQPAIPVSAGQGLAVQLVDQTSKVYLSSHAGESWGQTAAALTAAAKKEQVNTCLPFPLPFVDLSLPFHCPSNTYSRPLQSSLDAYGPKAEVVGAIRAAVMWNSVSALQCSH